MYRVPATCERIRECLCAWRVSPWCPSFSHTATTLRQILSIHSVVVGADVLLEEETPLRRARARAGRRSGCCSKIGAGA